MNEKSKRISYKMIAIVYALLFIALAMASAIGEYNNYEVIMFVISLICLGILIAYGYNEIIFIILLISLFMQIIHRAGEKYE